MNLRPYQIALIESVRGAIAAGTRRVLLQAPTGSGKTILTAFMLQGARQRGLHSWFIVHRRELMEQSVATLESVGLNAGVIATREPIQTGVDVQVAMIQTLARRLDHVAPPDVVVWDECHHLAAGSWSSVQSYLPSSTAQIGLSATPARLDGRGLCDHFDTLIHGPTVKGLIAEGFLSPYKYFAPPAPDLSAVQTRMGDYDRSQIIETMDRPTITGCAIQHYLKLCPDRRALVFCASIEHSEHVAESFRAAGVRACHLDGESPSDIRRQRMKDFRAGTMSVISSVDLFGEGLDVPGIEAVILLRPTQSLGLFLQQVGRSLRPQPGKTAIILDHVGNVTRHGFPCDDREWSLDSKRRSITQRAAPVKTCPQCYAALPISARQCPECGKIFATDEDRTPVQVRGDLVELTPQQRRHEERECRTYSDFIRLGHKRGYRKGWAWHRWTARQMINRTRESIQSHA